MKRKILLTSTSFQDTPGKHQTLLHKTGWDIEKMRGPLREDELIDIIHEFDAVICGDDAYTDHVIKKGANGRLRVISKYGVGLDSINLEEAKKNDIKVLNCPGVNQNAVAEHVIGLLLCFSRNIHLLHQEVQNGKWARITGNEILGRKIGVFGYGNVGKEFTKKCLQLGFDVTVCDPYDTSLKTDSEILNFAIAKNLENLVRNVDIISLHVPLTPETHEVFNQDIFRVSKKGLLIINTSRGKLVNNMDILRAIEENFISGYITDVLDTEPIAPNHPFLGNPKILITPHIGSRTFQSVEKQGCMAVENTINALESIS
ncbi:MAG: hypothetical protein CL868_07095 [Cytophagaceae bacterium]|nr:hypothetical protein [Cytophagaceae bacterium]|tara:strand:- start:53094 stop:54041 length:948 start_codon:yes stop_codon:yes gene_type:complete